MTDQTETKLDPKVNDDLSELVWVEKTELPKYMPTLNPDVSVSLSISSLCSFLLQGILGAALPG